MFLLLLAIGILVLLALYSAYDHKNYWKKRGVPGPEPSLFIGNLGLLGDPIETPHPLLYPNLTKLYGPYVGIQRGRINALIISDPDMANEIMHDQFDNFHNRDHAPIIGNQDFEQRSGVFLVRGNRWKRLRAICSSVLSGQNMKKVYPQLQNSAKNFIENLNKDLEQKGDVLDIKRNYQEFTADVLFRLGFAESMSRDSIQKYIPSILKFSHIESMWFYRLSWIIPSATHALKIIEMVSMITLNFPIIGLIRLLQNKINKKREERKQNQQHNDCIEMFLDFESTDIKLENNEIFDKRNSQVVKKLAPLEVFVHSFMFLNAGFDTVGNVLSLVTYHLAIYPKVQEKLRDEILEICGQDEEVEYDQLRQLKYVEAVIKETLRLVPIGTVVTSRRCSSTTKLGNVTIEKGTDVLIDVISIHHNADLWGESVNEFIPERWLREDSSKLMRNFYGFGSGPRQCVGMKLAYLELKLALVRVLQKYRIYETFETKNAKKMHGVAMGPKSVVVRLGKL